MNLGQVKVGSIGVFEEGQVVDFIFLVMKFDPLGFQLFGCFLDVLHFEPDGDVVFFGAGWAPGLWGCRPIVKPLVVISAQLSPYRRSS